MARLTQRGRGVKRELGQGLSNIPPIHPPSPTPANVRDCLHRQRRVLPPERLRGQQDPVGTVQDKVCHIGSLGPRRPGGL